MGCGGSQDKLELKGRLDVAEKTVKDNPSAVGDAGLDKMGECAQEIRYVMQLLIAQGAKDKENIRRIEKMSDDILGNLLSRITMDELKKGESSYRPLVDQIVKVANFLDAVRATKASDAVKGHVESLEKRIESALSQRADPILADIKAKREKLKEPKDIGPGVNALLQSIEKAHSVAPDSKKVTAGLMDHIVALSVWILDLDKAWSVNYASCEIVKAIAGRLDAIANKLVAILGAAWDPHLQPQVEHASKAAADAACATLLKSANQQMDDDNAGGAYDSLKVLLDWWPLLKEAGAHTLEIVGIFSKVQTFANDAFTKATAAGDSDTAEQIRGFAAKFDELRNGFEGVAPPAEGAGTLGESLSTAEAKGVVLRSLGILDAELAKTKDDDKSTNLSLAATVQALESLVTQWPKARTGDEDLVEQLDKSCTDLEAWTLTTAQSLPADRIAGLLTFAEQYDDRRAKLVPPAAKDGPLRPRIASLAASSHLKTADAELAKTGGLNPTALIDAIKAAAESIPGDSGTTEVRERLASTFAAVDERLLKTFGEMVSQSKVNQNKEAMLLKFASSLDELRSQCSLLSLGAESLVARMEAKRSGIAAETVARIVAEAGNLQAASGAGPDFGAILESLHALASTSAKSPLNQEQKQALESALSELRDKMTGSCSKAAADGSMKAVDEFLRLACGMDADVAGMALEPQNFQSCLIGIVTVAHLTAAEKSLRSDDPPDCIALTREMAAVEDLCHREPCTEDLSRKIHSFINDVEKPLIEKMTRVDAAGAKLIIEAAAAVDKTKAAAEGSEVSGDLSAKIAGVQAPSAKLAEAKAELAKPSGMNPNSVVKALQELLPLWCPVKDLRVLCDVLTEVVALFSAKLEEACKKATAADADTREKKVQAVLTLAQDADKAVAPLVALSKDLVIDSMREALARIVAGHHIAALNAELAKATGRNPAVMLLSSQGLAKVWPDLGGASAMDHAFDEVARIKDDWKEAHSTVKTRMQESMDDALKNANEKKKEALLKFATDFDEACKDFSDGLLAEELKAKMDG